MMLIESSLKVYFRDWSTALSFCNIHLHIWQDISYLELFSRAISNVSACSAVVLYFVKSRIFYQEMVKTFVPWHWPDRKFHLSHLKCLLCIAPKSHSCIYDFKVSNEGVYTDWKPFPEQFPCQHYDCVNWNFSYDLSGLVLVVQHLSHFHAYQFPCLNVKTTFAPFWWKTKSSSNNFNKNETNFKDLGPLQFIFTRPNNLEPISNLYTLLCKAL